VGCVHCDKGRGSGGRCDADADDNGGTPRKGSGRTRRTVSVQHTGNRSHSQDIRGEGMAERLDCGLAGTEAVKHRSGWEEPRDNSDGWGDPTREPPTAETVHDINVKRGLGCRL